jgi:hypothetical protein
MDRRRLLGFVLVVSALCACAQAGRQQGTCMRARIDHTHGMRVCLRMLGACVCEPFSLVLLSQRTREELNGFSTLYTHEMRPRADPVGVQQQQGAGNDDEQPDFPDADEPSVTKHWALLIAGSSMYANYRHQSDVAHAYQVGRTRMGHVHGCMAHGVAW